MNLPQADRVEIARQKITDYLLNARHPDAAGKAAFFAEMGFKVEHWEVLADALRQVALRFPVAREVDSPHGTKFVVEGVMSTPTGKMPMVRTVWIIDRGDDTPRLVTAYPHEGDNDAERT